jgi:spoIIIJ-associated protein
MSTYQEFTGRTVEEALKEAREAFGVGLEDLDFEILTPGSRGVLGMGAEPARIVAAPRSALGGAAPKREAAQSRPLPPPPRDRDDRGPRRDDRGPRRDDRGPRRDDRGPRRDAHAPRPAPVDVSEAAPAPAATDRPPERAERPPRRDSRPPRRDDRGPRRHEARMSPVSDATAATLQPSRGSLSAERAELQAAEAPPAALDAAKAILERLMELLGYDVDVAILTGETNRINVTGATDEDREELGALIGRKGERLSALQHLVNLMLSKQMGEWTRVLVDVEDYRGRRERQLTDLALRAAGRVAETGRMLQLEPMPALERRWVHLALRDHPDVVTQSVGEEPDRRIVVMPRP